ncbi:hypothetical protein AAFF_G00105720 [Aldrovandia affinis]|uniref:Uncharacterized protein n=1 Tax=Aldrovandia affinis TaxID=143900 RepID=A0AAD7T2G8_9TELE|nr:hypothetical protein AAFF_G00105720 [Aldrovandia affinis]
MDPGGSELESSLSQLDNPCLIVEDSQPDSAALEEDPDSSYRSLLARRLSSLQPTSPSPVLELISSPAGSRCSQTDSLSNVQTNTQASSAPLELSQSSKAQAHIQVLEECSPSNQNSALTPVNGKCVGLEMDAGADSTTQCAQSEGGASQFGFLELSESQGLGLECDGKEESQAERARTPPRQTDSQRQASQGALQKATAGLDSGSRDGTSKRAEVSSSCSSEPLSGDRKEMSIQHLLHGQDSEASAEVAREPRNQEEEDDDDDEDEVPSSQDDMFDAAKSGVDSTVTEPESQRRPTCTPAKSLHLLHLSGHGILCLTHPQHKRINKLLTSRWTRPSPDEPDCSHKRDDEPMDMDQPPVQSRAAPKPRPSASTPVSQHSPGFALEKSPSLPILPELSHDIFVPTQSQDTRSGSDKAEALMKKSSDKEGRFTQESGSRPGAKHIPSQSQHSGVNESFQLELSTHSEHSGFAQPPQEAEEGEDSQDTQIEGLERAVTTVTPRRASQEEGGRPNNALSASPAPGARKTGALLAAVKDAKETSSQGSRSEPKPAARAADATGATETIDLTDSGSSQKEAAVHTPHAARSQQKAVTVDLTTGVRRERAPAPAPSACVPYSLSSLSQSLSVLPEANSQARVVMDVQARSVEDRGVPGVPSAVQSGPFTEAR